MTKHNQINSQRVTERGRHSKWISNICPKANMSLCLIKHHAKGSGGIVLTLLTSTLDGDGELHTPTTLPPRKDPPTPFR
jgi:hypothetical protein